MTFGSLHLLLQPDRNRHAEALEARWRKRQVRLEQALEFSQRLLVEDDVVDVAPASPACAETILNGVGGKAGIMLLAGEPLLLRGGDDVAIHDESGGAVVVEGRNAENRLPRRFLRNLADDARADGIGQPQRQPFPGFDHESELRVLRALIRQRVAGREPVLPVQRHRLGAPLFLELERAFSGRGPAEIEYLDSLRPRRSRSRASTGDDSGTAR